MPDKTAIFDELKRVLEGNGTIPQAQRDRLMLGLLQMIFEGLYGEGGLCDQVEAIKKQDAIDRPVIGIIKWGGAILGAALIMLMWALLTGQATLIIK